MIPKKIHYCWLSGEKMPKNITASITSWKKVMPDYEFKLWDSTTFDISSTAWTAEAFKAKKWALAADYIRLHAVYTEGGIYLDTDVFAFKRFDDLLHYGYFTSFEFNFSTKIFKDVINSDLDDIQAIIGTTPGIQLEAGIFGGVKGHPFLRDCMDWYEKRHFILPDGTYNTRVYAPHIYAAIAQQYGLRYVTEEQKLEHNMIIFAAEKPFALIESNHKAQAIEEGVYAVHWHEGSGWWKQRSGMIGRAMQSNVVRRLFGRTPLVTMDDTIQEWVRLINSEK